jgi:hypothetical protein
MQKKERLRVKLVGIMGTRFQLGQLQLAHLFEKYRVAIKW